MIVVPGDRLRLNDGGPVLIAERIHLDERVECTWMDEMGQHHWDAFPTSALEKLPPFDFGSKASGSEPQKARSGSRNGRNGTRRMQLHTFVATIASAAAVYFAR